MVQNQFEKELKKIIAQMDRIAKYLTEAEEFTDPPIMVLSKKLREIGISINFIESLSDQIESERK